MRSAKRTLAIVLICLPMWVTGQDFFDGMNAYERGDYDTAIRIWTPLAQQGDVSAQYNLFVIYERGEGVPRDRAKSVKWLRAAAEQGDEDAQYNLGRAYHVGNGVIQNYQEALHWYRLSSNKGHMRAQHNLGVMYLEGNGVEQNFSAAKRWFLASAEQGNALSQNSLGTLYFNGQGVMQDFILAHMWFNVSASQGNENGIENRDLVAKSMSLEDVARAQELARECVARNYKGCAQ